MFLRGVFVSNAKEFLIGMDNDIELMTKIYDLISGLYSGVNKYDKYSEILNYCKSFDEKANSNDVYEFLENKAILGGVGDV